MDTYDGLLLLSFGGPEGPADVMPFLERVVRGRDVPHDRLLGVAEHYQHFGGVSPINEQNRALLEAIRADFAAHDLDLPVYWGNRNWHPLVEDTVQQMADDGVTRALVFVTSAYASYSACRQYQDDLVRARAAVGDLAPDLDKLRHFFDHPGFIEPQTDAVRTAIGRIESPHPDTTRVVFVAHSIPVRMAEQAGPKGGLYVDQLRAAARLIADAAAPGLPWDLAFCSRSGPPAVPWLEPDVDAHLEALAADGVRDVVVVPVGFVSDHIEVRWDLDVVAGATAERVGLRMHRTAAASSDPRFVTMVRELALERMGGGGAPLALSGLGPSHDRCPPDCCR